MGTISADHTVVLLHAVEGSSMPKMVVQGASEGSAEFWSAFALGRAIGLPGQREPEASQQVS